jgi:hypothetical protein
MVNAVISYERKKSDGTTIRAHRARNIRVAIAPALPGMPPMIPQ